MYHGDQQFENGHRPIEHSCRKESEKLKFRTLIVTYIFKEQKYKDEKEVTEIGSLYQELKFKRAKKKRKGNILFPTEEERKHKLRIRCKNYQKKSIGGR